MKQMETFAKNAEDMMYLASQKLPEEDLQLFASYFNQLLDIAEELFTSIQQSDQS